MKIQIWNARESKPVALIDLAHHMLVGPAFVWHLKKNLLVSSEAEVNTDLAKGPHFPKQNSKWPNVRRCWELAHFYGLKECSCINSLRMKMNTSGEVHRMGSFSAPAEVFSSPISWLNPKSATLQVSSMSTSTFLAARSRCYSGSYHELQNYLTNNEPTLSQVKHCRAYVTSHAKQVAIFQSRLNFVAKSCLPFERSFDS